MAQGSGDAYRLMGAHVNVIYYAILLTLTAGAVIADRAARRVPETRAS